MGITCSISWRYTQHVVSLDRYYSGSQTISFDSDGTNPVSHSTYNDTNNEFFTNSMVVYNPLPPGYGAVFYLTGCLAGGGIIPVNASDGTVISGSIINVPGQPQDLWNRVIKIFTADTPDAPVDVSANGKFYKDSSGNWHDIQNDNIVATAQEVSNLPQDVEFNGWLFEHEIIEGNDGKYYDLGGNEVFQNLPSGVIPVTQIIAPSDDGSGNLSDGVFEGTDGNYYNVQGSQVLENLPQGVTPVSQIGDVVVGSDGGYYDLHGDSAMQNLPSGVTITGYDDVNDVYHGSDGKDYDINGDEVEGGQDSCDGVELTYTPSIRLTIDCIDIFGNQQQL